MALETRSLWHKFRRRDLAESFEKNKLALDEAQTNIAALGTRERGATSVADAGTIAHSLGVTPTRVYVTPSVAGEIVAVTARGDTNFTVAIKKHDGTAGTTQTVYWEAVVEA